MDSCEATRTVLSRIQSVDPENASKIMGFLLIQGHSEKDLIRLAFGPESLLHSVIIKARAHLGLSSNTSPALPTNPNPLSSRTHSNGFNRPPPLAVAKPSYSPWSPTNCSPISLSSPSYAAVVNGTTNGNMGTANGSLLYQTNNGSCSAGTNDFADDYPLQEQFPFLGDSQNELLKSPLSRSDSMGFSSPSFMGEHEHPHHPLHRRSFSVTDACLESEENGFGWKPCLYFARGFCKNGSSCRFVHGGFGDFTDASLPAIGSPGKLDNLDQCYELLLRSKAAQQQRLAAASQLMAAGALSPYGKCMNSLMQQQHNDTQRSAAAALMMGENIPRFNRCQPERHDFSAMGLGGMINPGSRQIYLTFPADSTFREEDVSNYFSIYGPVQDVRIPYQQKRMFGFVTFVYPETVKLILAKGNPHFVCDSRVLVKPYKEKGKIPEKRQQHQLLERGEFSACSTPSGLDSRDPYDLQLGARMLYNTQEMLLRRKLEEQADLEQAIELQGRRMMNLQLLDLKTHQQNNLSINQSLTPPADRSNQPVSEGMNVSTAGDQEVDAASSNENGNVSGNGNDESSTKFEDCVLPECFEHVLPDNLFASPTKSGGNHPAFFSTAMLDADESTSTSTDNNLLPTTSTLSTASIKSCFLQMPR